MIPKIFATKLNKSFSMSGLISFSGETKTDNKLALMSLSSQLKFNLKKDIYKECFKFGTMCDNELHVSILCTKIKTKQLMKKEQCHKK